MPSALYFLKSICMREIIHSPRVVMMCDNTFMKNNIHMYSKWMIGGVATFFI